MQLFLSYSRTDAQFAALLAGSLETRPACDLLSRQWLIGKPAARTP